MGQDTTTTATAVPPTNDIAFIVALGDRIAALCDRIEARLDAIDRTNAATSLTLAGLVPCADGSEGNGWDDIDATGGGL